MKPVEVFAVVREDHLPRIGAAYTTLHEANEHVLSWRGQGGPLRVVHLREVRPEDVK